MSQGQDTQESRSGWAKFKTNVGHWLLCIVAILAVAPIVIGFVVEVGGLLLSEGEYRKGQICHEDRNGMSHCEQDPTYTESGDLDCDDISGSVEVGDYDPNGLDADGDGIGCEPYP